MHFRVKKISIYFVEEDGLITCNVKDFGPRISETIHQTVFDRSVQINRGKKYRMGGELSIVKRIAEANNGEISVKPNEPTGNIFHVTIPHK